MKRMIITAILAAGALLLAACATHSSQHIDPAKARTAAQTAVRATRVAFNIAVIGANAYAALPPCASAAGMAARICSDPGIVTQIAAAKSIAGPALDDAERIVNDPATSADASTLAVATLDGAFRTFAQVTARLPELSGEAAPAR